MEKLLNPASVAVVGASTDPSKVGFAVLRNLVSGGFPGPIYPINPKASELQGLRCYPSIGAVPGPVDLAVIVVNKEQALPVLRQCAHQGVPAAIVITAGFGETGAEGRRLQEEMGQIARQHQMTLLGPNCLGLINPWNRLNAAFGQPLDEPGPIAVISQSGALITAIQDMATRSRIGFSLLASLGNKASLDEVDFVNYLQHDSRTTVITAYLEDVTRGQEFMRTAERISKKKPIIVLKAGRTEAGARAAASHTGSLAGSDSAYESAFERCGVIRVHSIEGLFDVAGALAWLPLPRGPRTAIITNAGGPGIMMSDALEMTGLAMASLSPELADRLRQVLPPAASVRNPIDVLGDADGARYRKALEAVVSSDDVDACIVILTPQRMTEPAETADAVADCLAAHGKPILACFMGAENVGLGVARLRERSVPQYWVPERAARALREMVAHAEYRRRPLRVVKRFPVNRIPVSKIIRVYQEQGGREIGEADAMTVMEAYNFDVPPRALATTVDKAARLAREVGFPLAMKISSPDILHKSDVGGVRVNIHSIEEVRDTFELMMIRIGKWKPEADIRGILMEKMVAGGREVILGMKKDPQFGPVLMFGLGGIFVEVLKDVTFALAPLTEEECFRMIERTRSYRLLAGIRGQEPVDIPAVVRALQRLSQLVMDFPEIDEVDINPLKVGLVGDGAFVVDARIILREEARR